MLAELGIPFLRWLDETVLPEAWAQLGRFQDYVARWRDHVDPEYVP
jgi:hypothetical protein